VIGEMRQFRPTKVAPVAEIRAKGGLALPGTGARCAAPAA